MNRHYFSFVLMFALLATVFTSCNKEDKTEQLGPIAVNLKADIMKSDINQVTMRVANGQWEASDQVGLFMKRTGQALSDFGAVYGHAFNLPMRIVGQTLTYDVPVTYPTSGNVDFVAYYPYIPNNFEIMDHNKIVPVNISQQASGLPVEILYSNNITNQAPTELPVTLNFRYSLAKIELTVTGGENSDLSETDFSSANVVIENIYTTASLSLSDGTYQWYNNEQSVELHKKSFDATSATFEALIIPINEEITFLFYMGGSVYSHTMTANYASENLYKYKFTLDSSWPDLTATLLNAVIEPRVETPQQNISVNANNQITMKTEASEVGFSTASGGKMTIDWGDGTPSETYGSSGNYGSSGRTFIHSYLDESSHTITITGTNISIFRCNGNQLTDLEMRNMTLYGLDCSNNQLINLNITSTVALSAEFGWDFSDNQLTDLELNKLFNSLSSIATYRSDINIGGNPGTDTCDRSIAESKGWRVIGN